MVWFRTVATVVAVAVLIGGSLGLAVHFRPQSLGGGVRQLTAPVRDCDLLHTFPDEEALKAHLWASPVDGPITFEDGVAFARLGSTGAGSTVAYSGTNNQVEGVDEADIIKTDGTYVYTTVTDDPGGYTGGGHSVAIVQAYPPEEAAVVSRIPIGSWVQGLFVNGDRLVVLDGGWSVVPLAETAAGIREGETWRSNVRILVYDISVPLSPNLVRNVTLTGGYVGSRLIGDTVYLIVQDYLHLTQGPTLLPFVTQTHLTLPSIWTDGVRRDLTFRDLSYFSDSEGSSVAMTVLALDLQSAEPPALKSFLTRGVAQIYVSAANVYVADAEWERDPETGIVAEASTVHQVVIAGGAIEYGCTVRVPGTILNQFSMDEHRGYLRVATTLGQTSDTGWETSSGLYVFDETLRPLGELTKLAPGERIFSARFVGDRAYLVTFRAIDPLFVIDASDPTAPRLLGSLKIPGVSDYLHPYGDGYLLGFGRETVEGPDGIPRFTGLKFSLFDVGDVGAPQEIAKHVIEDRSAYSAALYDHRAFLFLPDRGVLVVPVTTSGIDADRTEQWHGVYVMNVTPADGFAVRGTLTHLFGPTDQGDFRGYWSSAIRRSLSIGAYLYTVSDVFLMANKLDGLDRRALVAL